MDRITRSSIVHVVTEKDRARVSLRNVAGEMSARVQIDNRLRQVAKKPDENFAILLGLSSHPDSAPGSPCTESEPAVLPEHILSVLPLSLQSRINEKMLAWEPVNPDSELQGLVRELDSSPIHNLYSVGVLYLAPNCISPFLIQK